MKTRLLILLLTLITLQGAAQKKTTVEWGNATEWYQTTVNPALPDVFYFVSTEILEEKDADGNDHYIGSLNAEQRAAIKGEMDYIKNVFGDSLNFFSPYYRQFTMSSAQLSPDAFRKVRAQASQSALDAFRYYLRHLNHGRPFILAGFSQGSMHMIDAIRQLHPKDYRRMIAAYSMGYRLSADDLRHPNIKAATGADDKGVIISFNSVTTPSAMWPLVNADAATCINPVNYHTDATPATFLFEGDTLTVAVDTLHHVLLVSGGDVANYRFPPLEPMCKPGNLHHWDILFYGDALRRNALRRFRNNRR